MKIRTRLLAVFVAFIFTSLLGYVYLIEGEIRPRYLEATEEALVDFSEMFAAVVSESAVTTDDKGNIIIDPQMIERAFNALPNRKLDALIYDLEKTQVDTRVYVTDVKGTVIFDSDNSRDVGEDYSQWRDVNRTLNGEYGARATWGDPIYPDGDTLFIARPILSKGDIIGVISIGKPTRNVDQFIDNLSQNLWFTGIAVAIFLAYIGFTLNLWITKPLDEIQQYALAVSRGEKAAPPETGDNEVGDVAKSLESMRAALDGKTYIEEYVQTLTHEIKAPVAGIRGASELLKEDLPAETRDRFLDNIVSQTERIQGLIERLLDLAELENANALKTVEKINLNELLSNVLESLSTYAKTHEVSITAIGNDLSIKGDPFLIEQALSNLVKNAIEHADSGTDVQISVSKHDNEVDISVSNIGPAIPDFALAKIFDRFFSLPNRAGQKGTGIGLSFVKEIVELHEGKIAVNSNSESTTFTLIL
ncbi:MULTISPECIES: two-component system sensor histidine kinase CreC [unclassified Marinobacterium]|uniref:two-component system sensor histidine kinase CreC n=1 Tax=unclassified Marinobacterium TaxID=2644139 RepID=UPI001569DBA7|nr:MULTISPECIES: two-component system sensor histidine kinase CreC [unclassified Marinobacterium]NRP52342.1 Sensor protein CreC [Marinobacterium sp. xm-v-242]NRP76923.1 Sensor protein CreC [Marinobacterium sp. xm-m-383]